MPGYFKNYLIFIKMAFLQDVGSFFKNLGSGVTTTLQGFGENIQSQASLNEAQAQAIIAASQTAAQTTAIRLQNEAEAQKRRDNLILYIIIAIAAVPILGMAIYYGLKK